MSKLDRLKNLPSAKTTGSPKKPVSMDFAQVVAELKAISTAQETSQKAITKSIQELSKVILIASEEGVNVESIVEAISSLQDNMAMTSNPVAYQVDFERDTRGLMKSGIRLVPAKHKLN